MSTSSLSLLNQRLDKYFEEIKQSFMHEIDINIMKCKHIYEKIYLNETLILIKAQKYREINSSMLN
jgi:hypothetical protein